MWTRSKKRSEKRDTNLHKPELNLKSDPSWVRFFSCIDILIGQMDCEYFLLVRIEIKEK